jgi:rubrerythrin
LSDLLNLEQLDVDGALRESAEAAGLDRGAFLRRSAIAGGGLIAGGAFFNEILSTAAAAISTTKKSKKNDVKILNYALTLEYLEAAFYKQAVANAAYGSDANLQKFAETVAKHEAKHVQFLKGALGSAAGKSPTFDFGAAVTDKATFAATAQVLEDTGVSAYLGQVANVFQGGVLAAAGTIATVEARHASWIRFINGAVPAPASFDTRKSEKAVLKAVTATGFIK